jgi:hypothetical protein
MKDEKAPNSPPGTPRKTGTPTTLGRVYTSRQIRWVRLSGLPFGQVKSGLGVPLPSHRRLMYAAKPAADKADGLLRHVIDVHDQGRDQAYVDA